LFGKKNKRLVHFASKNNEAKISEALTLLLKFGNPRLLRNKKNHPRPTDGNIYFYYENFLFNYLSHV